MSADQPTPLPQPATESVSTNVVALRGVTQGTAPDAGERARLKAALSGDGTAFAALVRPHLAVLYRIAARACGHPTLAEDAVQETLDLAYRGLARYRPGTSLRAFLCTICVQRAHTLLRGERRRRQREERSASPAASPTPEEYATAEQTRALIRRVLESMPDKRRTAALLRLDGGLEYAEIAAAMGSTRSAAKALVHLATADLRTAIGTPKASTGART